MDDFDERFGTDLCLLFDPREGDDPIASRVAHDRFPGNDLRLREHDAPGREEADLCTIGGVPNLQQALLLRFLTPKGALAHLGHPEYGTELHLLIGQGNTETNRNRAKLYVLESLAQEPRVEEVLSITVVADRAGLRDRIAIGVRVKAVGRDGPVSVTIPITLS